LASGGRDVIIAQGRTGGGQRSVVGPAQGRISFVVRLTGIFLCPVPLLGRAQGEQARGDGPQSILKVSDGGSSSNADYQLVDNQLILNNNLIAAYTGFRLVDLSTSAGSNKVSVASAAPNTDISVTGGAGGTGFHIGAGNLDGLEGFHVTLNGRGSANDTVVIDDSNATAGQTYQIGSFNLDTVVLRGLLSVKSSNVHSLTLSGASFSTYNVESTSVETILNGSGSVNIGTNLNNLDFVRGHVTVHGIGAGFGTVQLLDNRSNANNIYTIAATSVTRDGFAGLKYDHVASLALNHDLGNDVYNVLSTSAATNLSHGGGGTSTFNIGNGNLGLLRGPLTVFGRGQNFVNVNDQQARSAETYTVTASTLTRTGAALIHYFGLTIGSIAVTLNAGNHGNKINVQAIDDATSLLTVNAGAAGDRINITSVLHTLDGIRSVSVKDKFGASTLTVDDSAFGGKDTYQITASDIKLGRSGAFRVAYAGIATLKFVGGSGGDEFDIDSTLVNTTVNGGAGSNVFYVASATKSLASLAGHLKVNGGGGADTLVFFDTANSNSETNTFSDAPGSLKLSTVPILVDFSGMKSVFLETNGLSTVTDPSHTVQVDIPPAAWRSCENVVGCMQCAVAPGALHAPSPAVPPDGRDA
jgi:hypothetical protein